MQVGGAYRSCVVRPILRLLRDILTLACVKFPRRNDERAHEGWSVPSLEPVRTGLLCSRGSSVLGKSLVQFHPHSFWFGRSLYVRFTYIVRASTLLLFEKVIRHTLHSTTQYTTCLAQLQVCLRRPPARLLLPQAQMPHTTSASKRPQSETQQSESV